MTATARELRTALRTVETSSYAYFGVLRRSPSLSKAFDTVEVWGSSPHEPTIHIFFNHLQTKHSDMQRIGVGLCHNLSFHHTRLLP